MIALRQALADYLQIRRRLGFKLTSEEPVLENFVAFLEQAGAISITTELAVMWAKLPADARPDRWRQRLGIVRGFAGYLATIDPATEIPSKDLLPAYRPRVAPYIYSQAEIAALMGAAAALTPPRRAATYETVIGLMATSGLRLGEALWLDRQDVDLAGGRSMSAPDNTSSARCRCTTPRPRRCASTPVSATGAGSPQRRRRSLSPCRARG